MNKTTPKHQFSRTALGVAALRATHQLLDGKPKILDDPIVTRILTSDELQQIQCNSARDYGPWARELRAHIVLRSRYAEDRLARAVQRGVRQYVILGAGFDTFAYRQPNWAQGLHIYEVDHEGTQIHKRQRLQTASIVIPQNLQFIASDFESASLHTSLQGSDLKYEPTFFSCLGVVVYLTRKAAASIFQSVASFPPGSEIVFSFFAPEFSTSSLAKQVEFIGEPWRTYFEPRILMDNLRTLGFSEISLLSAEEAARAYFAGRNDGLRAPRVECLASAIVGAH